MAMTRKEKQALGEVAAGRFSKAKAAALAEYRGLTVAELTQLRVSLRKADAEFRITKNRVAKKAIEAHKPTTAAVSEGLKGQSASSTCTVTLLLQPKLCLILKKIVARDSK
jgi:large subunit ribosomal protein L10